MQNFMVILKILYELVQNYLYKIMMNIFKIILYEEYPFILK